MAARTRGELRTEALTLWHDFDHLCQSAARLRAGTCLGDRVTHNALVDGFALSCRKLSCFFFAGVSGFPPVKGDDLAASHYVAGWNRLRPAPSADLAEAKRSADRQVAHITADRRGLNFVPDVEYRWKIDVIERELLGLLRLFLEHAPAELLEPAALAGLRAIQPAAYQPASTPAGGAPTPAQLGMTATTCPPTEVRTICPQPRFQGKTE